MTNHVRTLLLNRGRDGYSPTLPGEEYLVPNYRARHLTGATRRAWECLFGISPDRFFLNYRLRQLMTLLHASELVEFVTAPDPRITYWPFNDAILASTIGIFITIEHGNPPLPYVFGSPVSDEGAGRAEQSWRILALASDQVSIRNRVQQGTSITVPLTFTSGLSQLVTLPGSKIALRFHPLTTDDALAVVSRGRPQEDIGEVLANLLATVGPEDAAKLFPKTPNGQTLLAVWMSHPISVMRYAALLLGLASAIEQSPQEA